GDNLRDRIIAGILYAECAFETQHSWQLTNAHGIPVATDDLLDECRSRSGHAYDIDRNVRRVAPLRTGIEKRLGIERDRLFDHPAMLSRVKWLSIDKPGCREEVEGRIIIAGVLVQAAQLEIEVAPLFAGKTGRKEFIAHEICY